MIEKLSRLSFRKIADLSGLPRVDSEKVFSDGEVPVGTSTAERSFLGKFGETGDWQFLQKLSQYYKYAVFGFLGYMPLHIFISQWLSTYTGGLEYWKIGKDIVTWLVLIIGSALVIWQKKTNKLFWVLWAVLIGYTTLHLILYETTDQPLRTGMLALIYNTRLMWYVLVGYSLSLLVKDKKQLINQATKLILTVSTIVCLVGLAQWILPKDVMTHFGYSVERGVKPMFFIDDKPDLPRVMSTVRDPNSLGAYLLLPIMLIINMLKGVRNSDKKMMLAGLLGLHLLILFLTFSRGAWLALALILAVYGGLNYKDKILKFVSKYKYAILGAVLLLGIFTYLARDQYVVQNVLLHSDENTKLADSNELHASLLQQGLEGIADDPEGHGPGTAGLVAIHNKGILTENYFVQIGYEVGILGLLIFIGWFGYIAWLVRKNTVLIAVLAGLTLMNMLFHTWANEAVACTIFVYIGLNFGKQKTLL